MQCMLTQKHAESMLIGHCMQALVHASPDIAIPCMACMHQCYHNMDIGTKASDYVVYCVSSTNGPYVNNNAVWTARMAEVYLIEVWI